MGDEEEHFSLRQEMPLCALAQALRPGPDQLRNYHEAMLSQGTWGWGEAAGFPKSPLNISAKITRCPH